MSQMCPDRQLLSVYFDGELPSPWKEKMERHVANCPHCEKALEAYRQISIKPDKGEEAGITAAGERVWQKLETRFAPEEPSRRMVKSFPRAGVWRRHVSVPLPAAAAVAVLFIALAVIWIIRSPETADTADVSLASETDFDVPGVIPVSDMESVLQYLSGEDNGEVIILRLPESRNFVNYGEPAIVRAADYSRRMPSGRMPSGLTPAQNMPVRSKP